MRAIGFFLAAVGALSIIGEMREIAFPTARWFFETSRQVPWLHTGDGTALFPWFGWLCAILMLIAGVTMMIRSWTGGPRNPMTARKIQRFREIKRGYYSLLILLALVGLAALDQVVVGKRALAVELDGNWRFPAFRTGDLKNKDFGIAGGREEAPADYRELKRIYQATGNGRVIMPLVPYDPTGDTLPPRSRKMESRDGKYHEGNSRKPYFGLVAKFYDVEEARMFFY